MWKSLVFISKKGNKTYANVSMMIITETNAVSNVYKLGPQGLLHRDVFILYLYLSCYLFEKVLNFLGRPLITVYLRSYIIFYTYILTRRKSSSRPSTFLAFYI